MKGYKLSDMFVNKRKYDVIHKLLVCVLTVLQITLYSVRTESFTLLGQGSQCIYNFKHRVCVSVLYILCVFTYACVFRLSSCLQ